MRKSKRKTTGLARWHTLSFKLTIGFLILAVLISASLCSIGYVKYKTTVEQLYSEKAYAIAAAATQYVDGERAPYYLHTGQTDAAYDAMARQLDRLREQSGAKYMYLYVLEGDIINYIYEASNDDIPPRKLGEQDEMEEESLAEIHAIIETGERSQKLFVSYGGGYFGSTVSAIVPVFDQAGKVSALLNVDISMTLIEGALNSYLLTAVGIGSALAFVMILIYLIYLRRKVISPIRRLTENAQDFVQTRKSFSKEALSLHTGDEIEGLAKSLGKMEEDTNRYIEDLTAITAEKERIATELSVATQIQTSMLPCIFPPFPERTEFDLYANMQTAREVGGDFYDFFLVDEQHLGVVIADVSGKGVPAALFMVIAKTLIKNHAQAGLSPAQVFDAVNRQLCENNEAGMFVTAFMGILDLRDNTFTFVNAGHNPPLYSRAGACYAWLKGKRCFVLGGMEQVRYQEQTISMAAGDCLFLYTDGVTEALDPSGRLYSSERLLSLFQSGKMEGKSLEQMLEAVKRDLAAFTDGTEQADDITMLLLQLHGPKEQNERDD